MILCTLCQRSKNNRIIGDYPINKNPDPRRSVVGIQLTQQLAAEGHRIFTLETARELAPQAGIKPTYLNEALYRLAQTGWVVPLRRGLYALASPGTGAMPAHEFEVAMALVKPCAIAYWSALHYHGLTEQIPRKVFALTTRRPPSSPDRSRGDKGILVGDMRYHFVHVKPDHLFGTTQVWVKEAQVTITDPERTLLDGLSAPRYCGNFAEVLHAFEIRRASLDLERVIGYAGRLPSYIARRLGWVLERNGVAAERLATLRPPQTTSLAKLDPSGSRNGPIDRNWMLQVNLPGRIAR